MRLLAAAILLSALAFSSSIVYATRFVAPYIARIGNENICFSR